MELWIRSQNKECITIVNHLYCNDDGTIKQQDDLSLGEYSSKERALDVLDEIQKILETRDDVSQMVYEMPQD